jgi:RNA polymerase sigma-70 factor (ECF subfamily)
MTDDGGMTPADRDDDSAFAEILAAAQAGDDRAIEWLFVRLQPRLLRFLNAHEARAADDIAGEVWLAIATQISTFAGGWSEFRSWVFSIARRRLADYRRTAVRRRTDVTEAAVFELRHTPDGTEQLALDSLSGQEAAKLIASTLRGDQAEVLLLRLLADLDVDEVAQIMNHTPNWVRVTQHRAVRNLAKRLGTKIAVMR